MVIAEVFYGVKCDRCGEIYESGEHAYYMDESEAQEQALESEWGELNGKHYCPNCHSVDEETDEIKPFPAFPKHVSHIRNFAKKMMGGLHEGIEEKDNADFIILKYSIQNGRSFKMFHLNYIRDFLDEKFVSLDVDKQKYWDNISITIKL